MRTKEYEINFLKNKALKKQRRKKKKKNTKYIGRKIDIHQNSARVSSLLVAKPQRIGSNNSSLNALDYIKRNSNSFVEKYVHKGGPNIKLPKIFSLVENPKESFAILKSLVCILGNRNDYNEDTLTIDYADCSKITLEASACMDVLLRDYFKRGLDSGITIVNGINLENEDVKKIIYSVGPVHSLSENKITFSDIIPFRLRECDFENDITAKEIDITNIIEHLESSLNKMNYPKMSSNIKHHIATIVGEVLTNSENHSSIKRRYSIGYFYERNKEHSRDGIYQIAIFNFGQTFYERLKDPVACKNKNILKSMNELSEKYTKKNLLKSIKEALFFRKGISEEALWTLYSIQDGVSCISPHRGNGTIQFLHSFFKLKGNPEKDNVSRIVLFSGYTRIDFDGSYNMISTEIGGQTYDLLTFNNSGSLEDLPDRIFVRDTPYFFPGTLLHVNLRITDNQIS